MGVYEKGEYDGSFDYRGRNISFYIVDNDRPIKNEKMTRYINFYEGGKNIGVKVVYGHVDKLTNITNFDAKQWFEEYLEEKMKRWK